MNSLQRLLLGLLSSLLLAAGFAQAATKCDPLTTQTARSGAPGLRAHTPCSIPCFED